MEVVLFSPRMGVSYTGRLVSVDAANQSLVVQVDDAAVFMPIRARWRRRRFAWGALRIS
jgi:hypothetical protein